MVRITDKKGRAHVFTLTDGTTLRVFAKKYKDIEDNLVSEEIKTASKLGLVLMENLDNSPPVQGKLRRRLNKEIEEVKNDE